MKLTINAIELVEWNACAPGIDKFRRMHEDKTVSLKDALESNTVKDWLYVFLKNKSKFSDQQVRDVKLFVCDCAEHVLHIFEEKYPDDKRPRICIDTTRKYINGECSRESLRESRAAAVAAADVAAAAAAAADDAAVAAADDAAVAAGYAAAAAAYANAGYAIAAVDDAAEREWQKQKLIDVIDGWL